MPPRKAAPKSTPNKLRQTTLHNFTSSSPPPPTPAKKKPTQTPRKRRVKTPPPPPQDELEVDEGELDSESDVAAIRFEPKVINLTSDDSSSSSSSQQEEEDSPKRPTTSRLKRKIRASSEEDSDVQIIGTRSKGKGRLRRNSDNRSGSEEDELRVVAKKPRLMKGVRPEKEDDEDLLDEVDEERIIDKRLRTRDKKTAFQKNLERLKRKKLGKALSESSSSSGGDESTSDEADEHFTPFAGAKLGENSDEDAYEDEFIVEDDNTVPELPMQYSMSTYQGLARHFKIICQLFVHLAVHPARQRRELMQQACTPGSQFYAPLYMSRREISGLRDSLVASSTWRSEFKKSLEAYPEFEVVRLEMAMPMCDACHMGGRISTLIGRVEGLPYDRSTFEPLDDENAEDDSDDSDSDSQGIGKLKTEFHLGRFCARRTRVFHQFSHWENTLYTVLSREVDDLRQGNTTGFVKVAFAQGIKPPEDSTDADGIVEWLDQRKIIDSEWRRLNEMMSSARNLDAASKNGEDQD